MSVQVRLVGFAAAALSLASALRGQQTQSASRATRGSVSGLVVDASTLAPLENATVALTPGTGLGAFPPGRDGTPFFSAARVASTARDGSYEFFDIPLGTYRLYVRRLGYEPTTLDVDLNGSAASQLSVGLKVVPVLLRAMRVQPSDSAGASSLPLTTFNVATQDPRTDAAKMRQRRFLGSDVRELTQADVAEAATLGGSDLFRALQRLPGVGSYDDWSTELWIRGSRWDQTRVYFDGLPLLNALHAGGTLTGVGTDIVGTAILHPSVRPASVGGEGVATLDLESRSGGGTGRIRGIGGLTSTDVSLSLDQATRGGRAAWMLSARRNAPLAFGALMSGARYSDVAARGDLDFGRGRKLEASGLLTGDDLGSSGYPTLTGSGWGNTLGRVTLRLPYAGLATAHTIGVSGFRARTPQTPIRAPDSGFVFFPSESLLKMNSGTDYFAFSGEIRPGRVGEATWSAGYSVVSERASFAAPGYLLVWDDLTNELRTQGERLTYTTVWADRRWRAGSRLTLDAGMRVDVGGRISGAEAVRPAPSVQARYSFDEATSLSVGAGRSYQYMQELPLLAVSRTRFNPGIWFAAGQTVPRARSDQANVGVERWTGAGLLLAANTYVRRSSGLLTADPTPGSAMNRSLFSTADENAYGAELSARRLTGRLTGSVAYSYGHASRFSEGLHYAAPGDRRHALDATALWSIRSFHVGAAFSAMSGLPFTRMQPGRIASSASSPGALVWQDTLVMGPPNARRFPNYHSVDLMSDWTRSIGRTKLTVFMQVPNLSGRKNLMWYYPYSCSNEANQDSRMSCRNGDLLYNPVGQSWPTFGARVAF